VMRMSRVMRVMMESDTEMERMMEKRKEVVKGMRDLGEKGNITKILVVK